MFYKILKKQTLFLFLLTFFIIPINVLAYSDYIIAGGESVGIKLNTDGIIVAGSYDVNGHNSLLEAGLKPGDIINQINQKEVSKIEEMTKIINNCNCDSVKITYMRNNELKNTNLKLYKENGVTKTGLYVKDSISGVGTLTFIDPSTKKFGVLGHEITESTTNNIVEIKTGTIIDSSITGIERSSKGNPGEKNAILYSDKIRGTIYENTTKGVFGNWLSNIDNNKLYKVANIDNIKIGPAKIFTVIEDNKVEEFNVEILSIKATKDKLKNIEIKITDKKLLNKTNGIVQGMSGSPIIQGEYIIGAVTHVVANDPLRGYGILIENMLEEAEN